MSLIKVINNLVAEINSIGLTDPVAAADCNIVVFEPPSRAVSQQRWCGIVKEGL